jgi:subtilisin family serine protease
VVGNHDRIKQLLKYSFVENISEPLTELNLASFHSMTSEISESYVDLAKEQLAIMGAEHFINNRITGKGVRIAVFDAGFPEVNTHFLLKHLIDNKQIEKTFDFTKKKDHVFRSNSHGLSTLSNIAGKHEDLLFGMAPDATFLLALTEVSSEIFKEEVWWVAAAEWADKNGVQIINSSLGYTYHRYFPEQMNGEKAYISRAANIAAEKGILVVNSAGNEGTDKNWTIVGAPADAEKVLSVGGISAYSGIHMDFASYGPTSDGRMKPNVSAPSYAAGAGTGNQVTGNSGTSFSSPLVAGFAACVLQLHPNYTQKQLFDEIQKSAHLYPYFDYAHGFGTPQGAYFFDLKQDEEAQFTAEIKDGYLFIEISNIPSNQVDTSLVNKPQFEIFNEEVNDSNESEEFDDELIMGNEKQNYLYFHAMGENGTLLDYKVYSVYPGFQYRIPTYKYPKNIPLRLHFKGKTLTFNNK